MPDEHSSSKIHTEKTDHFTMLRTIEDLYGFPHLAKSPEVTPRRDILH